jgi:hypothetical protein
MEPARQLLFVSTPKIYAHVGNEIWHIPSTVIDTEPAQERALTAIVFSAVALESFFNELLELASFDGDLSSIGRPNPVAELPPKVEEWIKIASLLERVPNEIERRYKLAHLIFTGRELDMGSLRAQNFTRLLELRNSLVHLRASTALLDNGAITPERKKNLWEFLKSRGYVADSQVTRWVVAVSTKGVAEWACDTVRDTIRDVISIIPEGTFKKQVQSEFALPENHRTTPRKD